GLDPDRILELFVREIVFAQLICCQDTSEPFAMARNRISRALAAPRRCPAVLRCRRMPRTIFKGLTPHASRVNGPVSVEAIPWRFTYLCWNIPKLKLKTY